VNGYRSLHTSVIGPEQRRIEIQIRTHDMHEIAELGVAAHWQYKQDIGQTEGKQYRWLREMLEIIEHAAGPEEFLEHTRLAMYQDQVFCFTPKGDLIALPRGATPVDFAYAVHSEIGDTCVGCKINGKIMPLRSPLSNGDQVEIVTAKGGTPSPNWDSFVVTAKARSRLRRFVRSRQRTEYLRLGQAMLTKAFRDNGYELSNQGLAGVLSHFEAGDVEDLYTLVGKGTHTTGEVLRAVFPNAKITQPAADDDGKVVPLYPQRAENAIPIRGLIPGMALHYANCCHPLPGDRIVGIVTQGKGVTIHTIDCETLESFHDTPERWLDVAWDLGTAPAHSHVGRVNLVVANERGTLGALTTAIAKHLGNINNLKITNRSEDFFEIAIDIAVDDAKHLAEIIAALRAVPQVTSVDRARG
jgi:GTP pyrophosphokinase